MIQRRKTSHCTAAAIRGRLPISCKRGKRAVCVRFWCTPAVTLFSYYENSFLILLESSNAAQEARLHC